MGSILIKGVELNSIPTDIYIEGKYIRKIGQNLPAADRVIDGSGKAIVPGFVNCHTHAAMTLFRGFGDDMQLMPWLEERIWPNEAKMTGEDVYHGVRLACLEMIKSGTTTFFDMYEHFEETAKAVDDMGVRAVISFACFDHFNPVLREKAKRSIREMYDKTRNMSDRITFAVGPHAIYTVSGELLQWIAEFAEDKNLLIHLHLAETVGEVNDCLTKHGTTPVRYLQRLGILSSRLVLAHVIHIDAEEVAILAAHNVKVVHNPASNMKLASGYRFLYDEMSKAGVTVGIGTDGCASSNNLDMIEAMRYSAFLGKAWRGDPEVMTASEMLKAVTVSGATITQLNIGKVEEGCLADLTILDLRSPAFTPNFNFVSNLVYAANGGNVDTVICDGRVLMENKKVEGESDILNKAANAAYNLAAR